MVNLSTTYFYSLSVCLIILFLGYEASPLLAQKSIQFVPTANNSPLLPHITYSLGNTSDSFSVSQLKFYVHDVKLLHNKKVVHRLDKQFHLFDLADSISHYLIFEAPRKCYNYIEFDIGIDSSTNVSGVQGEALDPMNGMYWTWQSGYINFKLEGNSTLCKSRKHKFQFHIGGFSKTCYPIRKIRLKLRSKSDIHIYLNIEQLLVAADLAQQHTIMSPKTSAVKFADYFIPAFQTRKP